MRQRQLGDVDKARNDMLRSMVARPEFGGRVLALGHSMSSVSSANRASPRIGANEHAYAGKARLQLLVRAFRHVMVRQAVLAAG